MSATGRDTSGSKPGRDSLWSTVWPLLVMLMIPAGVGMLFLAIRFYGQFGMIMAALVVGGVLAALKSLSPGIRISIRERVYWAALAIFLIVCLTVSVRNPHYRSMPAIQEGHRFTKQIELVVGPDDRFSDITFLVCEAKGGWIEVCGTVPTEDALAELRAGIESRHPPLHVWWNVDVSQ